jgi:DNA/RNA-binding protein KIN17
MKKERLTTSDEQRERMLIAEQIERAQAEVGPSGSSESPPPEETELKRDEGEKVVLSFAPKAVITSPSAAPSVGLKLNTLKPAMNPLKAGANPLKRPNVFKQAATPTSAPIEPGKKVNAPMSAAERLIFEDQERKRRKMEREAGAPLMT